MIEKIKILREQTKAGIIHCKKALVQAQGNLDLALKLLKEEIFEFDYKKIRRATKEGFITSYVHVGSQLGVLLELSCETDFVARHEEFQLLAKVIAMQLAVSPQIRYSSLKSVSSSTWNAEIKTSFGLKAHVKKPLLKNLIFKLKTKSTFFRYNLLKKKVEKNIVPMVLNAQLCIRDPSMTIEELIKKKMHLLGENIQIGRFSKFSIK